MAAKRIKKNIIPKSFDLYKTIKAEKQYKNNIKTRDRSTRKYIKENLETTSIKSIRIGQLMMFNYLNPILKEELKYYDAMPCTIFFGTTKTDKGRRVIGFNIHYYPPRMRYKILARIFDIFKPYYKKHWDQPITKDIPYFNFKQIISQLQKAKLDFGIRMYDPTLMTEIYSIPIKSWSKVVFSEGHFRKESRDAILNYWSKFGR